MILPKNSDPILEILYLGFETKEIIASTNSTDKITLKEDQATLGEVVVTAFGTQRKAAVVGAIKNQ